jgi:hypothetical protein
MSKAPPCKVWVLAAPEHDEKIIGLHPVPGRLPAMGRWPGEALDQFLARAAHAATNGPDFWAVPLFAR